MRVHSYDCGSDKKRYNFRIASAKAFFHPNQNAMTTPFRLFISCLLYLVLPLTSGYGSENNAPSAEQNRKAGERMVLMIQDVEYAFRWCPAGTFMMGSLANELGDQAQHQVTLTHGFWMLETVMTQLMWEKTMGNNPSLFKGSKLPVETVSWNNCQEYITKLNALLAGTPGVPAGYKFSLPTEAQWEYACRAGTTTAYHFGDSLNQDQANFGTNFGRNVQKTTEVGIYPANAWGLYDMHGNVSEWCADWYGDYPSGAVTDPTGATFGSNRVVRGGRAIVNAGGFRSADRSSTAPSSRGDGIGFRLALVRAE